MFLASKWILSKFYRFLWSKMLQVWRPKTFYLEPLWTRRVNHRQEAHWHNQYEYLTHHCFLFLAQQETGEMPGLCQLQPPQTQHHSRCRRQGKTVLPGRSTNKIYFTYHNSTSMTVAKNPPVGKSYCPQLRELAHQDFFQQYLFGITPITYMRV